MEMKEQTNGVELPPLDDIVMELVMSHPMDTWAIAAKGYDVEAVRREHDKHFLGRGYVRVASVVFDVEPEIASVSADEIQSLRLSFAINGVKTIANPIAISLAEGAPVPDLTPKGCHPPLVPTAEIVKPKLLRGVKRVAAMRDMGEDMGVYLAADIYSHSVESDQTVMHCIREHVRCWSNKGVAGERYFHWSKTRSLEYLETRERELLEGDELLGAFVDYACRSEALWYLLEWKILDHLSRARSELVLLVWSLRMLDRSVPMSPIAGGLDVTTPEVLALLQAKFELATLAEEFLSHDIDHDAVEAQVSMWGQEVLSELERVLWERLVAHKTLLQTVMTAARLGFELSARARKEQSVLTRVAYCTGLHQVIRRVRRDARLAFVLIATLRDPMYALTTHQDVRMGPSKKIAEMHLSAEAAVVQQMTLRNGTQRPLIQGLLYGRFGALTAALLDNPMLHSGGHLSHLFAVNKEQPPPPADPGIPIVNRLVKAIKDKDVQALMGRVLVPREGPDETEVHIHHPKTQNTVREFAACIVASAPHHFSGLERPWFSVARAKALAAAYLADERMEGDGFAFLLMNPEFRDVWKPFASVIKWRNPVNGSDQTFQGYFAHLAKTLAANPPTSDRLTPDRIKALLSMYVDPQPRLPAPKSTAQTPGGTKSKKKSEVAAKADADTGPPSQDLADKPIVKAETPNANKKRKRESDPKGLKGKAKVAARQAPKAPADKSRKIEASDDGEPEPSDYLAACLLQRFVVIGESPSERIWNSVRQNLVVMDELLQSAEESLVWLHLSTWIPSIYEILSTGQVTKIARGEINVLKSRVDWMQFFAAIVLGSEVKPNTLYVPAELQRQVSAMKKGRDKLIWPRGRCDKPDVQVLKFDWDDMCLANICATRIVGTSKPVQPNQWPFAVGDLHRQCFIDCFRAALRAEDREGRIDITPWNNYSTKDFDAALDEYRTNVATQAGSDDTIEMTPTQQATSPAGEGESEEDSAILVADTSEAG